MSDITQPAPLGSPPTTRLQRLAGRWWRRQSPARQDRFATLAPLASVLLFLAAIISAFWYLRNEEMERETESVRRDTEITQQQIGLRLIENQEQVYRIARELVSREIDSNDFSGQVIGFVRERPEINLVHWLNPKRGVRATHRSASYQSDLDTTSESSATTLPVEGMDSPTERAFMASRDQRQPVYTSGFRNASGEAIFHLHVPLVDRGRFAGVLLVEYSVSSLLRHFVPPDVARRHVMSVVGDQQALLASTSASTLEAGRPRASITYDAPLTPALNGLVVRGEGWRASIGLISNTLFWMVVALSVLTVWMLLGTWRHMQRRAQIQTALVQETQFRRAMENSMLTGMRALDMDGRITYVNAAFCQMSGFSEEELIGCLPPYPYWPPDRIEENQRLLEQEMQGRSPAGGIEVRLMRKDGQMFDARMYVSPLIDPRGQQAGWMTSMTNITEAKRIRDQLSASHERFTTVLEGLDASVSVLSVQQNELLFANRSYRLWFGADARGHALLAGSLSPGKFAARADDSVDDLSGLPTQELTDRGGELREVYVESLNKWFDVRSRYLQWTDGSVAQMLIATDVTTRLKAEEQVAQQAERASITSRLMTMGEMASSVAHELNQPLTAISNYCSGMVSRVNADAIQKDDLLAALRKTAHQAERAGQIIHRIRAFVKKSEPQRQPAHAREIVDDAVELASIALRRRSVSIRSYVAQHLPVLMVDPILIEQVVLNLLKNAAEAIDAAQMPPARRTIELRVVPRHTPDEGGVIEFSVTDGGPGLPDEVIKRLYEAFFSTKSDGLGIGLSLCRSIVESHQGRMRAQNLYNGMSITGCRFSFTLPVEISSRHDAERSTAAPPTLASPPPSSPSRA
ncbi:MAG: PAS domain S-box protein [Rubrivivax sp.]|nr:PAS domain S-box protein [Rubrivivax sp.]